MSMPVPDITIAATVMRSASVYLFLPVAVHVAVKRPLGQPTAFDGVVPLVISNVLPNAAIGSDSSLGGGRVRAAVIIALSWLVAWLTVRHERLGITAMSEVRYEILEKAGHVSVLPRRFVPA